MLLLLLSTALLFRLLDFLLLSVSPLPLLFSQHTHCPLSQTFVSLLLALFTIYCVGCSLSRCPGLLNGLLTQVPVPGAKSSFVFNQ